MVFKKADKQFRNPTFDLLRIMLTILVINVHVRIITGVKSNFLEPYTWYTVPLFIILSFFFVSNKPLIIRIKRLFLPLVFWSTIGFIVHPNLINNKNIFLQMITGHVVNTPLYYLVLLIIFTIIYWLINKLSSRVQIFIYSLIVLIALFLEYSNLNYNFFSSMIEVIKKSYGRFVELIKFIPVGLVFAYLSKKINNKNIFIILSSIFLILFFIVSYIPVPPDFHFSGLKTLMGSISIFSLVVSLSNFRFSKKINTFINSFGKYSFGVYLSHYLLLEAILITFPLLKSFIIINQFLFLFCFVIFCYLFCFFFDLLTSKRFSFLVK